MRVPGRTQQSLPALGLGCMGLSEFYGPPTDKATAIKLLHEAIELGVEHFDTAEMYGMGANDRLVGGCCGHHQAGGQSASDFRRAIGILHFQPGHRG